MIGSTTIDLENRFLSLHRPLCGLPETFSKRGPNRWRDSATPVDMLKVYSHIRGLHEPTWDGTNKVRFNNNNYLLQDFEMGKDLHAYVGNEDQRLALHILRQQNIVPEHVEKRTLFNPVYPGVPQLFSCFPITLVVRVLHCECIQCHSLHYGVCYYTLLY